MQKGHIMKHGLVKVGTYKGSGSILITETHLFAFRHNSTAMHTGGRFGGLVGALIGMAIDAHRANSLPPPLHLEDPDLAQLANGDVVMTRVLKRSTQLAKVPVTSELTAVPTFTGFQFKADGHQPIHYGALLHKRGLGAFLLERGIPVQRG
jgi:hypothetical protein